MSQSQVFFFSCLAFIGGIFLRSFFFFPLFLVLFFFILSAFFIFILFPLGRKLVFLVVGLCLLFFTLGVCRQEKALNRVNYPLEGEVDLLARVVREVDLGENSLSLIVEAEEISGKILVTLKRYPEYDYANLLRIQGKLEPITFLADLGYQNYLLKEGIYSSFLFPRVELVKEKDYSSPFSFLYHQILIFKNQLRKNIYQNLPSPQDSVLAALILGDKKQMSGELKENLNLTGVRHLTAVSGLHLTILTSLLMNLLLACGLSRRSSFYWVLGLISLFVIMIGLPSSAIRAGIMTTFLLLAQHLGRANSSSRVIFFTAAIMLFLNPLLLRFDLGFQLSFLAVLGLIYFNPFFKKWFRLDALATTLSAQVLTLPILIYSFGYFSLVAPLVNLLLIPLMPFIMFLGFIFSLVSFLPFLSSVFLFPLWLLLTFLLKVVSYFSSLSLATLSFNLSSFWLVFIYLILFLLVLYSKKVNIFKV